MRTVARTRVWNIRPMRSSSSDGTASSAASTSASATAMRAIRSAWSRSGSKRASNSSIRSLARWDSLASVSSTYPWLNANPIWSRVLRVAAQDVRLRTGQPGAQHQTIEAVGLDRTGQQPLERGAHLPVAVLVDLDAGGHAHADVVDEAFVALDHEPVRVLVGGLQPDMAEHRQQVRQRDRLADPVHAHAPEILGVVDVVGERGGGVPAAVDER